MSAYLSSFADAVEPSTQGVLQNQSTALYGYMSIYLTYVCTQCLLDLCVLTLTVTERVQKWAASPLARKSVLGPGVCVWVLSTFIIWMYYGDVSHANHCDSRLYSYRAWLEECDYLNADYIKPLRNVKQHQFSFLCVSFIVAIVEYTRIFTSSLPVIPYPEEEPSAISLILLPWHARQSVFARVGSVWNTGMSKSCSHPR